MSTLSDRLSGLSAEVSAEFLGVSDEGQLKWTVTIRRGAREMKTPFSCGSAHVSLKGGTKVETKGSFPRYWNGFRWLSLREAVAERRAKPVPPSLADVVYCLLSDAYARDVTFEEWCSEFGHDTDSRKAHETYSQCSELGLLARRLFPEWEELSGLEH